MTKERKTSVLKEKGLKCFYCDRELIKNHQTTTIDHIIPKEMGGSDEPENLVPCCVHCNSEKNGFTPDEWIKRIEYKISVLKGEVDKRKKMIKNIGQLID